MSSSIWTACAGGSEGRSLERLALDAWRVVEAQHRIATRKLVGSDAEQAVLEALLEAHKPPIREGGDLHYLLFTPFRYPPLRRGSRFGSRWEPGIWYGSESIGSALAEVAYYRLLFLEGSNADLGLLQTDLTAFRVPIDTDAGVDLAGPGFDSCHATIASPTSYAETQPLGATMREVGVRAFRYPSARDPAGGANIGLFTPGPFVRGRPDLVETWRSAATKTQVEFRKHDYFEAVFTRFDRDVFLVDGDLPRPAV
jgi:hypothetical protein